MKLERSENTKRGVVAGAFNRVLAMLFPFLIRTAIIHRMGIEYLGLNSLFSSILQVLSLSELGFSSAIIYSMYKPLADNDTKTINALLSFFRNVYRVIGTVITIVGIALIPVLHKLINGTAPSDINIYLVYLVYLGNTVISYFFYGYLSSILNAHQRLDIQSLIASLTQTLGYICQLIVILSVSDYYLYILFLPISTLLNNFLTAFMVHKMYPMYRCEGDVNREQRQDIRKRVVGIMIEKICGTTRNALDSICISTAIGLSATAIYNNYFYIIASLTAVFYMVLNAIQPGVGNSMALDSTDKNYDDMVHLNFGYMLVSGWSFICLICLYQPFMKLWVGEGYLLPVSSVLLFSVYFYVLRMGDIRSVYAQAAGLWWENRRLAILESVMNIVLNIIFVMVWGINGVISATILSLFGINFCLSSGIVFKYYFKNGKLKQFFMQHAAYAAVTLIVGGVTGWLCLKLDFGGVALLAGRAVICVIIPALLYTLIYMNFGKTRLSIDWLTDRIVGDKKQEMLQTIRNTDKNKLMKETVIVLLLAAGFFGLQKYMANLSYMYFDTVSLAVRVLYSVVLADTALWTWKKVRCLYVKDEGEFDEPEWWTKISDLLFCLSFGGCYVLSYIAITKLNAIIPVYGGIHRLGITLCCMFAIMLYNRKKVVDKRIFLFQTVLLVSAIGYMSRFGDIWIYAMAVFTVCSYGRRFVPVMWITVGFNGLMLVVVPILAKAGVIEFIEKRNKLAFGYGGPNEASMQILFFELGYFYLRYLVDKRGLSIGENKSQSGKSRTAAIFICDACILLLGTKAIVSYTAGRASIVCILVFLAGTIVYEMNRLYPVMKWNKWMQKAVELGFLILMVPSYVYVAIVSFTTTYFYNQDTPYKWLLIIGKVFDPQTLEARLWLGKRALMEFEPSMLGTNIIESSRDNYFWVDNYYIRAYLKYGIMLFICGMIVFTLINYINWKKKNYYIVFILTIIAGLGFLEATIGDIMYNVFPLLIFTCDQGLLALHKDKV